MNITAKRFVFALALLTTIPSVYAQPKGIPLRANIVGGTETIPGEFPFMASLQSSSWGHFCGGSLIRPGWVLTAAHCARAVTKFDVVLGAHDLGDLSKAERIKTQRVIVHPNYNSKNIDNDFALVQLAQKSVQKPIEINREEIKISDEEADAPISVTAGWGATSEGGGSSDVLLKTEIPLVSETRCLQAYPGEITSTMICAGLMSGGKDSCQGDSGGPLMTDHKGQTVLSGVVSWGEGCARPGKPGVYSKVNAAEAWIEDTIANAVIEEALKR